MSENLPAEWREMADGYWQYLAPGYAVYATIALLEDNLRWAWDARVMFNCERKDNHRTAGIATSKEGAMRIVEAVCSETGTCEPANNRFKVDANSRTA